MTANLWTALRQRWQQLSQRERQALAACAALLALALLWWVALAPALATWRDAPARIEAARQTLQRLQDMAQEAQALQTGARAPAAGSAREQLRQASESLGAAATLTDQGDTLVVTLQGVPAEALGPWLTQVRLNARLQPAQVRWLVGANGLWSGTVVFAATAP